MKSLNKLPTSLLQIKKELHKTKPVVQTEISMQEKLLLQQIKEKTNLLNMNNITRTQAYWNYYLRHPEIHWALLAHMVSRNAGWNMTDLKGTLLPRLLTEKERISFFTFLEKGNWLIFQDAYPQLLIYEESKKAGKNLFHLLPSLEVSVFMIPIWTHFWEHANSAILTTALIVNEQNYIQLRIMKEALLQTLAFKFQDLMSMNQILFPYMNNGKTQLLGATMHHFDHLHSRISFGKKLYSILFKNDYILEMIKSWGANTPHTASRKDFWPHLFNDINEELPGKKLKPRIQSCSLVAGSPRFYSPKLQFVWNNTEHSSHDKTDWYKDWKVVHYLQEQVVETAGNIEGEYCKTLERIELAVIAKSLLFYK